MENIPVMGMSPMHGGGFEQVSSDDDGLAASTVFSAVVRSKDFVGANAGLCVPRQKAVCELDFSDVNPRVCSQNSAGELDSENLTACNRVETAPCRHVSFAETLEMVGFDPAVHAAPPPAIEYDAPAPNMAYRVHAAPAPMVEYDAPAPTVAYRVHAAPAPAVEYDAPASTMEYQAHAAPAPVDEYDAPAARAALLPWWTGQSSGEDNRDPAVADYRENRRYSRNPDCPKHPIFREFGDCSSSRNGACGDSGRGGVWATSPC